ncbi:MAG: hypothetical protein HYY35_00135 [Deltaproteobacteria bacterium]|nr:hypothetical protein [Deltaproteobacteria bacterium]
MKSSKRFHSWVGLPVLVLAVACGGGGGGGGGESFTVTGLWSTASTSAPGAPTPDDTLCGTIATQLGPLPGTTLDVVRQDGTVTATEVGSGLAFGGTVDDAGQSFMLDATAPICQTFGSCTVCTTAGLDFSNAAANSADVNVAFSATGSGACPVTCTIVFSTTATRS